MGVEDGRADPVVGDREDTDVDSSLRRRKELDDAAMAVVARAEVRLGPIGIGCRLDSALDRLDGLFEPVEDELIFRPPERRFGQLERPMPRRFPRRVAWVRLEDRGERLPFASREPPRLQASDQEFLDLLGCHVDFPRGKTRAGVNESRSAQESNSPSQRIGRIGIATF